MRAILVATVFAAVGAAPASAHTVGISKGEYRIEGSAVSATAVVARQELIDAVPGLDANRDGILSEPEVAAGQGAVVATVARHLRVQAVTDACPSQLREIALTDQDGVDLRIEARCPGGARPTVIAADFVSALSEGHRHLAVVTSEGASVRHVLYRRHTTIDLESAAPASAVGIGIWPLFRLGVEHILTGYDHLVFLVALILVGGRVRSLCLVVTAFTVAHSVTLGVAALGIWTPGASVVEPAIALSIAYVGIENWFVADAARRWMITLPFGLVHGFGFAGALREISLTPSQVPVALAAFNVGVEAGQLAVLAAVLPVLIWLRRRRWLQLTGVRIASTAIAAAGLCWFVGRVL